MFTAQFDELRRDVSYALRVRRRTPAFTATVVLTLGVSIGATTAMLTVFHGVLIQSLPVRDQDRIVVLGGVGGGTASDLPLEFDQYRRFRDASRTIQDAAGVVRGVVPQAIMDGDLTFSLTESLVTGNFFRTLGARPGLGRLLGPDDDVVGVPRVIVLSHAAWRRQFGGDPDIIGRQVTPRGPEWSYTIVGVAPAGFEYPASTDYWTPVVPQRTLPPNDTNALVHVVGRLAPGVVMAAAQAELLAILQDSANPANSARGRTIAVDARTLPGAVLGEIRPVLIVLASAVTLLLLIGCANIRSLLSVHARSRSREMAIRCALGAGRGAIRRPLLAENAVLAVGGGMAGLLVAFGLLFILFALAPPALPRLDALDPLGMPLVVASAITWFSVLIFGLAPSLGAVRSNLVGDLVGGPRSGSETRGRRRVGQIFVAGQMALALMVLAGAGLLVRSLAELQRQELGFSTEHVSIFNLTFPYDKYPSQERLWRLFDQVIPQVRSLPTVSGLTPILIRPFLGVSIFNLRFDVEGRPDLSEDGNPFMAIESAGADYFQTLGVQIVRGRGFTDADRSGAIKVVVVSEAAARAYWPAEDPLGQRIRWEREGGVDDWRTVVGVAGETRYRDLRTSAPTVYLPHEQFMSQPVFAIRTQGEFAAVLPQVRSVIHTIDPDVVIWQAATMDELIAEPLGQPRLSALILSGFSLLAVFLAAVGLYGVMSLSVRRQTRDLGVRLALGATPRRIRRLVLGQALGIAAIGALLGLAGVAATSRVLVSLLYEVSPTDPVTLAVTGGLLFFVVLLAAYFPMRRATLLDPMEALRVT